MCFGATCCEEAEAVEIVVRNSETITEKSLEKYGKKIEKKWPQSKSYKVKPSSILNEM